MNMTFRTVVPAQPAPFQISHSSCIQLIGSCFTEHIAAKLTARKFLANSNPFGIVYNPISMLHSIQRLWEGDQAFIADALFNHNGLWHSWEHHGRFSMPEQNECLQGINTAYQAASAFVKKADCLLLTFGTAEVFSLRETGKIVANNHKMPSALFESRRLELTEIVEESLKAFEKLPNTKIVLTLSPVRHLRNGLIDNQRSKATLILACEQICRHLDRAFYFPAYELIMDDLRDYRFYASDMTHPSELAIEYVWDYFSEAFFSEPTRQLNERIEKIRAAAQHRPFHPETEQHQAFVRAQLAAIQKLKLEAPTLNFDQEIGYLKGMTQD